MSQVQKLIIRLLNYPKDFSWAELIKFLKHFGYEEFIAGKTGGSRRKFIGPDKHIISLHKPHPGKILKRYQIENVVEALKEKGSLNE